MVFDFLGTMAYTYMDGLPAEAHKRYVFKINLAGLSCCPYKLPGDSWQNQPKAWPTFEYADLYNFLIKSPRKLNSENHCCGLVITF